MAQTYEPDKEELSFVGKVAWGAFETYLRGAIFLMEKLNWLAGPYEPEPQESSFMEELGQAYRSIFKKREITTEEV